MALTPTDWPIIAFHLVPWLNVLWMLTLLGTENYLWCHVPQFQVSQTYSADLNSYSARTIVNIWRPIVASQTDDRQETAVYDHHREDKEG